MFSRFFKRGGDTSPPVMPWDAKPSIYEHVRANLDPQTARLRPEGEELPDEPPRDDTRMRFVAGGLDGIMGHHGGAGGDADARAKALAQAVARYCGEPTATAKLAVYELLRQPDGVLTVIDKFVEALPPSIDAGRLYDLSKSLATQSPHREPVKAGIAILGRFRHAEDREIHQTLGRHEEFTLFAAVALAQREETREAELWELARHVDGWGRVHIVERLAPEASDPKLKDWLLRDGFRNSIMNEYLALTCAQAGDLRSALAADSIDDELLRSSGEMIDALISGGPCAGIEAYPDAAEVVKRYLEHLRRHTPATAQLVTVAGIRKFVTDELETLRWSGGGWDDAGRAAVAEQCARIIAQPHWPAAVAAELESNDSVVFFNAKHAAKILGIDPWPVIWARVQREPLDEHRWYDVGEFMPAHHADEVIAMAQRVLPLKEIASGPGESMGFGKEFTPHRCLDFVMGFLAKHPGKGTPLLLAGLRSPVIRNRNVAVNTLSQWGESNWPPEVRPALDAAARIEPRGDVRQRIAKALAGEPLV